MSKAMDFIKNKYNERFKQGPDELLASDIKEMSDILENWQNIINFPAEALKNYLNDPISWYMEFRNEFQGLLEENHDDVSKTAPKLSELAKKKVVEWQNKLENRRKIGAVSRKDRDTLQTSMDNLPAWQEILKDPQSAFKNISSFAPAVQKEMDNVFGAFGKSPAALEEMAKYQISLCDKVNAKASGKNTDEHTI